MMMTMIEEDAGNDRERSRFQRRLGFDWALIGLHVTIMYISRGVLRTHLEFEAVS